MPRESTFILLLEELLRRDASHTEEQGGEVMWVTLGCGSECARVRVCERGGGSAGGMGAQCCS